MKKTSRRGAAFPLRRALTWAGVLLLIMLALVFRNFFTNALRIGVGAMASHNPFAALAAQLHTKAALVAQNEMLQAQLASTTAALADRNALYEENLQLKSRLGRDVSVQSILAGVILRPPSVPYDTLTIDAGSDQGVTRGALVTAGGTTVIGTVDEVETSTARVTFFSAPGEKYQALLLESSAHGPMPVVVEGHGGGTMTAQVPAHSGVAVGDSVVLSGIVGEYTAKVVAVNAQQGESFETLYMRLPVNLQALQFVEVLK